MGAEGKITKWLDKGSWDVKLIEEAAEIVWGAGKSVPPKTKRTGQEFARFEKKLGELVGNRIIKHAPNDILRALAKIALTDVATKVGKKLAKSVK